MGIITDSITNKQADYTLSGTIKSSVTTPEAALKIELNNNLVRYLFFQNS